MHMVKDFYHFLITNEADVAEYINLILYFKQKLNTAFEPTVLDSKQSFIFKNFGKF